MVTDTIRNEWRNIREMADDETYSDKELATALRSYVRESMHVGFDGFDRRERTTIRRLLHDMSLYVKYRGNPY